MATHKVFKQHRFGVRTSFDFEDDRFDYMIGDISSRRHHVVDYPALDLPKRTTFAIANNGYLARCASILVVLFIAVVILGGTRLMVPAFAVAFATALFLSVAMLREWAEVTFTEIPTFGADAGGVRGFVRIIRDRHHDTIMEEIGLRWRTRLKVLYGQANTQNDPTHETARLNWLRQHDVIDVETFAREIDKVRKVHAARDLAGPTSKH